MTADAEFRTHTDVSGTLASAGRAEMTGETRALVLRLLDDSLSQIVKDSRGKFLDGWPMEEARPRWERNPEAMLVDTWSSAIIRVATGEVPW